MNIVLFGATGRTGQEILKSCIENDFSVTAFVRDPSKLNTEHSNLVVVKGDVFNLTEVSQAVKSKDVVISSLGVKFLRRPICLKAAEVIIDAMKENQVNKFISLSAYGSRKSDRGIFARMLRLVLITDLDDKAKMEELLKQNPLDYIIMRPVILTNDKRTGNYRVGEDVVVKGMSPKISRADVAHFICKTIIDGMFQRKMPTISY